MTADKCSHCRIIVKAFDEQICIDTSAGTEKGSGTNVFRMQPRNVGCKQGSPRNKENLPTLLSLPLRFSPNTEKTHPPFFLRGISRLRLHLQPFFPTDYIDIVIGDTVTTSTTVFTVAAAPSSDVDVALVEAERRAGVSIQSGSIWNQRLVVVVC